MTANNPLLLSFSLLLPLLFLGGLLLQLRRVEELLSYLRGHPGPEFWPRRSEAPLPAQTWLWRGGLLVFSGIFLGLSLAGPRGGDRLHPVYRPAKPLVLVLDLSRSMEVGDVPLRRLGQARVAVRRILGGIEDVPVGLVVFAGEARILLPPTTSRDLLLAYLANADPAMLTNQGSALADGLALARELVSGEGDGAGVLLLTDGELHEGEERAKATAERIQKAGGWLSAVSFGRETGGVVPLSDGLFTGLMIQPWGAETDVGAPLSLARPEFLAELAHMGGGVFASGENPSQMTRITAWIETWARDQERGVTMERRPRDLWGWCLALALLGLMVEMILEGLAPWRREIRWS